MSLEEKYQTVVREVREKGMGNHPSIRGPMVDLHTTYRYYGHHIGDPGTSYRTKEEIEQWKKRDPIDRLRTKLLTEKVMTRIEVEEIKARVERELGEAVKFALESPQPKAEDAVADIYHVGKQKRAEKCAS